jgi:Na+(H+)/acetate symporter ActP
MEWGWALPFVMLLYVHWQVMKNKKSISNIFCMLEDAKIPISRAFLEMSFWEAWSGDMIDPPPLEPGQNVHKAFKAARAAREAKRKRLFRGFVIAVGVVIALVVGAGYVLVRG